MVVDPMEMAVMWVEDHLVLVVFVEQMEKMELLLVVLKVVVLLKHWVQPNETVEVDIVRTAVVVVVVVYDVALNVVAVGRRWVHKLHLIQVLVDVLGPSYLDASSYQNASFVDVLDVVVGVDDVAVVAVASCVHWVAFHCCDSSFVMRQAQFDDCLFEIC